MQIWNLVQFQVSGAAKVWCLLLYGNFERALPSGNRQQPQSIKRLHFHVFMMQSLIESIWVWNKVYSTQCTQNRMDGGRKETQIKTNFIFKKFYAILGNSSIWQRKTSISVLASSRSLIRLIVDVRCSWSEWLRMLAVETNIGCRGEGINYSTRNKLRRKIWLRKYRE